MFGMLDADKDGFVTSDEALVFVKNSGGRGFGGGRGRGRGGDREHRLQEGGGVREKRAPEAEKPAGN